MTTDSDIIIMSQEDNVIYAEVNEISEGNFQLQENRCYQTTRCDSDVKNEEIIQSRSQNRLCVLALAFLIILLISIVIAGFAVAFVKITNLKSEITNLPSVPALEMRISILNDQYKLIERTLNTSSDTLQELSRNYSELENNTMAANNALEKRISILNDHIERMLNTSSDMLKELSQNYSALENRTVLALEIKISILNDQYKLTERILNISLVYTRWGESTCRSGVNRVYAGRTGSSHYTHSGGGANYICMPNDPEYSSYFPGVQGHSYVYGTEYQFPLTPERNQHNVPCAVCDVPNKSRVLMIPAKLTCPSGWTREYYGYLMSEHLNFSGRTMYTCVDVIIESVPGSQMDTVTAGGHFYHVEAHCNGVACPPYNNYKELTCVVCSK